MRQLTLIRKLVPREENGETVETEVIACKDDRDLTMFMHFTLGCTAITEDCFPALKEMGEIHRVEVVLEEAGSWTGGPP